jgi:hypothetical protein
LTTHHSNTEKVMRRRRFLKCAVAGSAAAVLIPEGAVKAFNNTDAANCQELTAADPLYLYASLIPQLQPAAVIAARQEEAAAVANLSDKLRELWTLSDKLKTSLSGQSRVEATVERMSALARVGHTNIGSARAAAKTRSADVVRAHMVSQTVITNEIVNTSLELSKQERKLGPEEWSMLQKMFGLIDQIKEIHQPAVIQAGEKFDVTIKSINLQITNIQEALMDASRHLVLANKVAAVQAIRFALKELAALPASKEPNLTNKNAVTRDQLVEMITPTIQLAERLPTTPPITRAGADVKMVTIAFAEEGSVGLPNAMAALSSVREVAKQFFVSGSWWQVVGITAACLPLWAAYAQSDNRRSLIQSAISAVPRGRGSRIDLAADALNRLT